MLQFDSVDAGLDLKGKPVAVFGLGDSIGYGEYFCDAMEELYSTFKATGAKMVGHWPADDYQHEDSKVALGHVLDIDCSKLVTCTSCPCTSVSFPKCRAIAHFASQCMWCPSHAK